MKSSQETPDEAPTPPDRSTVILLLRDIGNVTWRMFAPVIAGLVAGLLIDSTFDSMPWGVIVGLTFGVTITIMLMRNVFKKL